MSVNFRNLLLLALLCGIISSLSISSQTLRSHNRHLNNIHETIERFVTHDQTDGGADKFVTDIQTNIDAIVNSIKQDVPSIIQTKNIPTFSFPKSTCDALSQDQKNQLIQKVKSARQNVTDFKGKLNAQTDKNVSVDADNSLAYLNLIEVLSNRTCRDVKNLLIGPTSYQTNINTNKPWILGGIKLSELVKEYVKRITVNNNVTNCGAQTPFWTGIKCIKCQAPKNIFNIATGQCTQCPKGTQYDQKTKACVPGAEVKYKPHKVTAQPKTLVPEGTPQNALPDYLSTGDTQCPVQTPQVKDNVCIQCPEDKPLFNIVSKQCQACPQGSTFIPEKHICGKPIATDVPVQTPRLKMNDDSTDQDWNNYVQQNKNKILCPKITPYWDGQKCIPCPDLFNIITKKCDVCQGGLKLSEKTHKCQPAQPLQPQLIDLFNAIF